MSPRYKRTNRRYNIKTPREKMSFEKKTLIQSVSSLVILAVFVIASFMSPSPLTKRYLYTTYNSNMWKIFLENTASGIKSKAHTVVNAYAKFIDSAENRLGITKPQSGTAKAQKKEIPPETKEEDAPEKPAPKWQIPTEGEITSEFGARIHPVTSEDALHTGIDIAAPRGQTVNAASEGSVVSTGSDDANGNYIVIDHGENTKSVYAHLDTISVSEGQSVDISTAIGTVGSTGISTGPHLHFEIKVNEKSVNPADFFNER